jgi:putative hydrolase of the HAD superfamily
VDSVDLSRFKIIIFDLGEVIIDLNPKAVIDGFVEHFSSVRLDSMTLRELIVQSPELYQFEVGAISEEEFVTSIAKKIGRPLPVEVFRAIWNKMLLPVAAEKINLLEKLSASHRIFFLSNTNLTHQLEFDRMFADHTGSSQLEDLVEKAYYSHRVGMRKPEERIYKHVLEDLSVEKPEEVIFVDDREENTRSAEQLGIETLHLKSSSDLLKLFTV